MNDFIVSFPGFSYEYKASMFFKTPFEYDISSGSSFSFESFFDQAYTGNYVESIPYVIGHRSDFTQLMANSFQDWNRIRTCPESTGQYFLNSLAMGIEDANKFWKSNQRELFLETADINQPYKLYRYGIPSVVDLEIERSPQLLANPDFSSVGMSVANLPTDWTCEFDYSSASVRIENKDSFIGTNSVRITSDRAKSSIIKQTQSIVIDNEKWICFSLWHKTLTHHKNIDLYSEDYYPPLVISIETIDDEGKKRIYSKKIPRNTDNSWIRSYLSIRTETTVGSVTVSVSVVNENGFKVEYLIDALQLEENEYPSNFRDSEIISEAYLKEKKQFFKAPFIVEEVQEKKPYNIYLGTSEKKVELSYIEDTDLFLSRDLLPTRIEEFSPPDSVSIFSSNILGIFVETNGTTREKGWLPSQDKLLTYEWPNTIDTGKSYYIAEFNTDKSSLQTVNQNNIFDFYHSSSIPSLDGLIDDPNYTLEIKSVATNNGYIWAACQEKYKGMYCNTLKIIRPVSELTSNFLYCIKDFKLGKIGYPESIGFSNSDPKIMSIVFNDNGKKIRKFYKIYCDYFTYDEAIRSVYTREKYEGQIRITQ